MIDVSLECNVLQNKFTRRFDVLWWSSCKTTLSTCKHNFICVVSFISLSSVYIVCQEATRICPYYVVRCNNSIRITANRLHRHLLLLPTYTVHLMNPQLLAAWLVDDLYEIGEILQKEDVLEHVNSIQVLCFNNRLDSTWRAHMSWKKTS